MYDKIRKEIQHEYYVQHYPNEGQRFVAWYVRNIHARDMNEAKADVMDGSNDKQIDAIVVDDNNNTIYVIQGKFASASTIDAEPLREVLASWIQLKNLVRLQETGNARLKQKLAEVAIAFDDEYDVEFELITTATLTEAAQNDLATFQNQVADSDDFSAAIKLIDESELKRRYDMALDRENPVINHELTLEEGKYMIMDLGGTNVVVAALPLKDCISLKGIKDGTLFQKNVRQSLGLSNRVNKGIRNTIYHNPNDFFFRHNGITAICSKLEREDGKIKLHGLSVVNGCQSLNTILSCSEKIKQDDDAHVMFRFYEIPQRDRADKISVYTNSQSAVKPRDLRSNDKRVLGLKKQFEQKYPQGHFLTKRGEVAPASQDKKFIIDLSDLGKYMIAWHSQRPNIAYSETKIFDKYFEQLFKKEFQYPPENVQALNEWMQLVNLRWGKDNPLGLNESLLAMKAYAPYHHLYAISQCFNISNGMPVESVPNPRLAIDKATVGGILDQVVDMAGSCLNTALEAAANEPQPPNRVFSPQNWVKTKSCLAGIRASIRQYLSMLPSMPNAKELSVQLKTGLSLAPEEFSERWSAD